MRGHHAAIVAESWPLYAQGDCYINQLFFPPTVSTFLERDDKDILYCIVLYWIGLDWIGFGLDWIGLYLDWIGLYCIVLYCIYWIGLDWIGLDCIVSYCIVLYCIVLYCIGFGLDLDLDWIGL